jgi:hypothetical protein
MGLPFISALIVSLHAGGQRLLLFSSSKALFISGVKKSMSNEKETVNHPAHYNQHPSGIECIDIVEHFNFNIGNAIKYLWRAGLKGDAIEDLKKAAWYVQRESYRREKEKK